MDFDDDPLELDDDTLDHYQARADRAGRTLSEQITYELSVNHELAIPDAGDEEATHRAELFHRMRKGKPLLG